MTVATIASSIDSASWPDAPHRIVLSLLGEGDCETTSTVGGDYALPSEAEDDDAELRAWAELARRARERWAKENPY